MKCETRPMEVTWFPGCSMKTSAIENHESFKIFCEAIGIRLVELPDWNCCGSSSAHSIDRDLAFDLVARNLALAPSGRPILTACPSCTLRFKEAHHHLMENPDARNRFHGKWGVPFDESKQVMHFFELIDGLDISAFVQGEKPLSGLTYAPYYGCMLARPPQLRRQKNFHGLMEKILGTLGARAVTWQGQNRCCGTFLSVARPDAVTEVVNGIVQSGIQSGAECLITACAMCQLNLEIRCNLGRRLPVLHFSEILTLALGRGKDTDRWFKKHLVDPRPLLDAKGLI
ncbi:CoB--CoM heterodisulfide reductase iron-sulfur subunit B family protein [Desulfoluna spongiiphila]|uniref:CoB--CoM heterodisulfide reductase iron-sulfur subunit B family protein n=1 Tax=Desulfoluna spongiiphila TaxID=419481 RepID=UPI00125C72CA|nr:heterodisulfide reductase-related iron-sulfur binding cluster [Desulfoluna spongiiphila]VVS92464.1 cysteine-rich domain [Desulfoluna spongiiphila]